MSRILLVLALFVMVSVTSAAQPWLGVWTNSEKAPENWDQFVAALGLPLEQFSGNPKATITITRDDGDNYKVLLDVPAINFTSTWNLRLGEEMVMDEFGSGMRYNFTEDGDKLQAHVKISAIGKQYNENYEVVGQELIITYKMDGIVAKRFLKRDQSS
ncbi:hypothetical protein BV898_01322 [Hypsibius exemplaris]|uniref:Lipocalin-like domain-containing protein n=1 Tax=Hypsibius exemplaris TaxID=2072580 RepID=A0A1W0XB47_HYPEX|nr:hypothetical protein BV898_01322 [Hypsibius exemplaris]